MDRRPRQDGHLVDQQRAPRRAWINPRFAHEQSPPRRGGDQGDRRGGRVDTDGYAALRLLTPHRPRSTALACRCLTVYAMRTRVVIPAPRSGGMTRVTGASGFRWTCADA